MNEFIAALVSATIAVMLNRWALPKFGIVEVIWVGPVFEELAKTGVAWGMGATIPVVHMMFGVIEGAMDIYSNANCRYTAAIASIFGHTTFGYLTFVGMRYFDSLIIGLIIGMVSHVFWNGYVMVCVAKYRN